MVKIIKGFVIATLLFLIAGCGWDIPWRFRADEKPIYVSKYFTVKPSVGRGWSVEEITASSLSNFEFPGHHSFYGHVESSYFSNFRYEPYIFDEFIPKIIAFEKHGAWELWPHPPRKVGQIKYTIAFYTVFTDPARFNYDARLIAEAEREKLEEKWKYSLGKHVELNEVNIANKKFFELLQLYNYEKDKVLNIKYLHFSKDLEIMYVIDLPPAHSKDFKEKEKGRVKLSQEIVSIIEGFEPIYSELPETELAMGRSANILFAYLYRIWSYDFGYHFTRNERPVLWKRAEQDLESAIKVEPNNYKAHMFLGLLNKDTDIEKAIAEFQKAIEIKPTSYWVRYYF